MVIILVFIFCPVFLIVDYEWNLDKNDDSELNSQTNDTNSYLADRDGML